MNDMTPDSAPAPMGHNNPPTPIEAWSTAYDDTIHEVNNWLDGQEVETDAQLAEVDSLLAEIKAAESALKEAKEGEYRPHKDACDKVVADYKPHLEEMARMKKGLAAVGEPFKIRKREAEEAARRAAYEEAERLKREAEMAETKANAANIEEVREAAAAKQTAQDAKRMASQTKVETKGLRSVWKHEVVSTSAVLRWINENDRAALDAYAANYSRQNHREMPDSVVRSWQEKEAF